MHLRTSTCLLAALVLAFPTASRAALATYSQNFETLTASDPNALANDGWVVYGNVFSPDHSTFLYGYGTYPAPNGGTAFCAIATGQGGANQGNQQLSVYCDYNNLSAMQAGDQVEANVYHEQTISAGDAGALWTLQFDAKLGNLVAPSTAVAFIKVIDPTAGYATTKLITASMTSIPATWGTYALVIPIDSTMAGKLLQFGCAATATSFQGSGVFYDNITFTKTGQLAVGDAGPLAVALAPAAPNPFSSTTRLDWSLARAGDVDVTVFDLAGRRVATVFRGAAAAGVHSSTWDGRLADGRMAPAGVYRAVLRSPQGRVTRSMVLAH